MLVGAIGKSYHGCQFRKDESDNSPRSVDAMSLSHRISSNYCGDGQIVGGYDNSLKFIYEIGIIEKIALYEGVQFGEYAN